MAAAVDDDFGKMFGAVASTPDADRSRADDDFDRMFGPGAAAVHLAPPEPLQEPAAEIPVAIATVPPVPSPPIASASLAVPANPPGDFTQMFQAPKQEEVPVPAVVSAPPVVPVSVPVPPTSLPANPPSPLPPPPAPPPVMRPPVVPSPPAASFPVDRSTMVAPPNLSPRTFDPPKPPPLSQTVEFNRLFEERPPPAAQAMPPAPPARPVSQSGGMTVEFNRLFEPDSSPAKTMQGPAATPNRAPLPERPVGEFTQMIQQQGVPPVPPGQPGQQSPGTLTQNLNAMSQTPRPGGPRPMSYMTAQQGEFTQMFQAPQRAPMPGRPPTPPPLPPPPGQANQPGEFTQMFQSPGGMPTAAPPPAVGSATSDFSALFHNQGRSNADFTPNMAPPPIAPPPPRRADDFEELFGGAKAQPQPLPASQPGFGGGGSVTSAFSTPPFSPTTGPASQPFSGGASPLSPAAGGGSYTQFIQRPGTPPALGLGQQPPVAKLPLPPPVRKPRIPNYVWVGGGVLLLLIVATITFFALRKH